MAPVEGQDPCPVAAVELWPANREAWEAYGWVGEVTQPPENHLVMAGAFGTFQAVTQPGLRPPPLDLPGVIRVLGWLGLDPGEPAEREELLGKLLIIHAARQKADLETRQVETDG